jgi:hypothetical protein
MIEEALESTVWHRQAWIISRGKYLSARLAGESLSELRMNI